MNAPQSLWRRFSISVSVCILLVLAVPPLQADALEEEQNAVRLKQLRGKIDQLRHVLKKVRTKKSKVQIDLRKMEKSISRINRKLRRLRKQIRLQRKSLKTLYTQRKTLKKGLSKQRQMLGSQVRASYVMGRQEQLKIVLNQGDPSTVQRALVYFDYLNRSRTDHINSVIDQLRQLQIVETNIIEKKQRLEGLKKQQAQRKSELVKNRNQRKTILRKLTRDIISKDKKLVMLLQNEKELQRILKAVEEALSDIPVRDLKGKSFAERKGKLSWPANGRIKARFGSNRVQGALRWSGVLISARLGDEVRAVARGRIAFADWIRGYGLMVIIDHGDGYMSLYGHNQSLLKEIGEWVEEGESVALVGNSGGQLRSQLYFELRYKGKPVNPSRWCRRTPGGIISQR
ncbi:MAG: peptidoglycan DD-metalloendopeptidase family protein [Gammaproteobacteria bacterium]|nr:peptidoglycan DD-metalloendopeptidase family protein [Gammaproteobacteria bacterium]